MLEMILKCLHSIFYWLSMFIFIQLLILIILNHLLFYPRIHFDRHFFVRIEFTSSMLCWPDSWAVLGAVLCCTGVVKLEKNKLWNGGCWFGRRSEKVLYSSFWIHKYSSSLELTLNRKIKTKNERWNFWLTSSAKFSSGLVVCLRFWSWSLFKYDVKPSTRSSTQSKTSRMSEDNLSDTVGNFWWTFTQSNGKFLSIIISWKYWTAFQGGIG